MRVLKGHVGTNNMSSYEFDFKVADDVTDEKINEVFQSIACEQIGFWCYWEENNENDRREKTDR